MEQDWKPGVTHHSLRNKLKEQSNDRQQLRAVWLLSLTGVQQDERGNDLLGLSKTIGVLSKPVRRGIDGVLATQTIANHWVISVSEEQRTAPCLYVTDFMLHSTAESTHLQTNSLMTSWQDQYRHIQLSAPTKGMLQYELGVLIHPSYHMATTHIGRAAGWHR